MYSLSIIVPIYNADTVIHRCCKSILEQSLYDIELILVNDGSTDNSLNVCRDFEANHSNVTLINIVNSGPANARNVGLKKAKSEYIGFVDADDYIDKNMYKTLYTAATKVS